MNILRGPTPSLIVVEDNFDDETLTLKAISESGVRCDVVVVRHGGEALDLLLSPDGPTPSLVVLDFHLPGYNGLEILRALRNNEKTRHLPIVILSGLGANREITDCLTEGANSCIQKPTDPDTYLENVALTVRYWLTVDHRPEAERPRAASSPR